MWDVGRCEDTTECRDEGEQVEGHLKENPERPTTVGKN